jgi:hypothetical protein
MATKRRATYPKQLRAEAKSKQHGLCTVSIEFPNGELMEHQGTIDVLQGQFAKWAMALLFCDEVRRRPDLESVVKELMK